MKDDRPKSAYEIALEKLQKRDRETGASGPATLTGDQKKGIAEVRRVYEARLAEREILHRSDRVKVLDHPEGAEQLKKLEEDYQRDRRRLEEQREREIEKVRAGRPPAKRGGGKGRSTPAT